MTDLSISFFLSFICYQCFILPVIRITVLNILSGLAGKALVKAAMCWQRLLTTTQQMAKQAVLLVVFPAGWSTRNNVVVQTGI